MKVVFQNLNSKNDLKVDFEAPQKAPYYYSMNEEAVHDFDTLITFSLWF
ncbi:hypothetical protein [Streptococcus sp. HF-1907]|nr:hypothetical protein [Streptococcus sp. HF-1907]